MSTRVFGLIGYPLSHSFSKKFFTEKFAKEGISSCQYELFPIENIGLLTSLLAQNPHLCGINVTIPYKVSVIPYLNELDEAAASIGAVNCITVQQQKEGFFLKGHNTDAYGFEASLRPFLKPHHQKALIFGNGGAAKAVKYVLHKLGISFLSVVRSPTPDTILYEQVTAALLAEHTLLINTTPLGMSPNIATSPPIPYQYLSNEHLSYDLVYNPEETQFLQLTAAQGGTVKNGLEMLVLQAERSWEIWNS